MVQTPDVAGPEKSLGVDFLAQHSDEARRWLAELRKEPACRIPEHVMKRAMTTLRHHQIEEGRRLLEEFAATIPQAEGVFPSLAHLMWRYYFAARAYACYMEGDLEQAKRDLDEAHEQIVTVMSLHGFLVPFAIHCTDFMFQRARIARHEHRWLEVKTRLEDIRQIYLEEAPFCELHSGKEIYLADLRAFFDALQLDTKQSYRAGGLLGNTIPVDVRSEFVEEIIFTLPDQVIPYP